MLQTVGSMVMMAGLAFAAFGKRKRKREVKDDYNHNLEASFKSFLEKVESFRSEEHMFIKPLIHKNLLSSKRLKYVKTPDL